MRCEPLLQRASRLDWERPGALPATPGNDHCALSRDALRLSGSGRATHALEMGGAGRASPVSDPQRRGPDDFAGKNPPFRAAIPHTNHAFRIGNSVHRMLLSGRLRRISISNANQAFTEMLRRTKILLTRLCFEISWTRLLHRTNARTGDRQKVFFFS
jgi:hypothetical protein